MFHNVKRGLGLAALVGSLFLEGPLVKEAGAVTNPNATNDSNVYVEWDYGLDGFANLNGNGFLYIENVGSENRNQFQWNVDDLLSVSAPGGWSYSYSASNSLVTLIGDSDELCANENISIGFTFSTNAPKYVGEGTLGYYGPGTSGQLNPIGVPTTIPEPGTTALLLAGGLTALAALRRKNKTENK